MTILSFLFILSSLLLALRQRLIMGQNSIQGNPTRERGRNG